MNLECFAFGEGLGAELAPGGPHLARFVHVSALVRRLFARLIRVMLALPFHLPESRERVLALYDEEVIDDTQQ